MPGFLKKLKMPQPLEGVIDELRERGLLPVALGLIVAIVAVPVLLSSGSSSPQPSGTAASGISATLQAPPTQPVVVSAGQGVRNYKKRLDAASAKNPFVQQYVAPATNSGSTLVASGAAASGNVASPSSTPKAATTSVTKRPTKYVSYTLKAYVGEAGTKLTSRPNLQRLALLPSSAVPVADFLGVSENGKVALFMVSPQVTQLSGDGVCVMGATTCSLLTLSPGKTATFAFGGKTYAVKLVKINRVLNDKPVG